MKAIGQAQGALAALAALLPDDAERVDDDGRSSRCRVADLRVGDVVLVRAGRPGAGRRPRSSTARAELDESMITGESRPVASAVGRPGRRRHRRHRLGAPGPGRRRRRGHRAGRHPAAGRRGPGSPAAGPRCSPTGSPRCCSTSPPAPAVVTFVVWCGARRPRRGGRPHRHRAGDRLPARARPGHPAGHRAVDRASPRSAGILVKDRLALERMRTVDAVLFDKTGTLTKGAHVVTGVAAAAGRHRGRRAAPRRRRRGRQRTSARPGDRRPRPGTRRPGDGAPSSGR